MRQSQIALLGGRWERRASHAGEGGVQRSCLQLDFTCDALTITPSPLQGCQRRPPGSRDRSRRTIDRVKYDAPDAEAGSLGSLAARHHQQRPAEGLVGRKVAVGVATSHWPSQSFVAQPSSVTYRGHNSPEPHSPSQQQLQSPRSTWVKGEAGGRRGCSEVVWGSGVCISKKGEKKKKNTNTGG